MANNIYDEFAIKLGINIDDEAGLAKAKFLAQEMMAVFNDKLKLTGEDFLDITKPEKSIQQLSELIDKLGSGIRTTFVDDGSKVLSTFAINLENIHGAVSTLLVDLKSVNSELGKMQVGELPSGGFEDLVNKNASVTVTDKKNPNYVMNELIQQYKQVNSLALELAKNTKGTFAWEEVNDQLNTATTRLNRFKEENQSIINDEKFTSTELRNQLTLRNQLQVLEAKSVDKDTSQSQDAFAKSLETQLRLQEQINVANAKNETSTSAVLGEILSKEQAISSSLKTKLVDTESIIKLEDEYNQKLSLINAKEQDRQSAVGVKNDAQSQNAYAKSLDTQLKLQEQINAANAKGDTNTAAVLNENLSKEQALSSVLKAKIVDTTEIVRLEDEYGQKLKLVNANEQDRQNRQNDVEDADKIKAAVKAINEETDARIKLNKLQSQGASNNVVDMNVESVKQLEAATKKATTAILSNGEAVSKDEKVIKTSTDANRKLAEAQDGVTHGLKDSTVHVDSFSTKFRGMVDNVFKYKIASNVFDSVDQAIMNSIQKVKELDDAMTQSRLVTGDTAENAQKLVGQYADLAIQLHTTTQAVAEGSTEWLRQGKSAEDTQKLLTASTTLAKVGMMDAADSTEDMTAALNGFKLGAEDAMNIVDKFSALDLKYATSADEIATALKYVASSAGLAGVSIDKMSALITVASSTTRLSAETIGNAFKSIISRMENIKVGKFIDDETNENLNDVEAVLKKLGIQLRDSKDSWRDMEDVIDEVGQKWNQYNDIEKSALATSIAGTRQRNIFIATMDNYNKVMEATAVSTASAGTAQEKYAAIADSIDGKLNTLSATWDKLVNNLNQSGNFKSFIDGGIGAVNMLDKLVNQGHILNVLLPTIGVKAIGVGFEFLTEKLKESTVATEGLSTAFKGLSMSSWITIAVLGITTLITAYQNYNQQQQEAIDKAKQLQETYQSQSSTIATNIKTITGLTDEFNQLSKGVDDYGNNIALSSDEYERYKEIVKQVIDISPELQSGYDKEGNAIANKNGLVEKSIALLKEQQATELNNIVSDDNLWTAAQGSIGLYNQGLDNANKKAEDLGKTISSNLSSSLKNSTDRYNEFLAVFNIDDSKLNKSNLFNQQGYVTQLLRDTENYKKVADTLKENPLLLQEFVDVDGIKQAHSALDDYVSSLSDLEKTSKGLNSTLQLIPQTVEGYETLNDTQKNFVTDFINGFTEAEYNTKDKLLKIKQEIKDVTDEIANNPKAQSLINQMFGLDKTKISASDYEKQINDFINQIAEILNENPDKLKVKLGLDVEQSSVDKMLDSLDTKLQNNPKLKNVVDKLPVEDLKIAYKLENIGNMTPSELTAQLVATKNAASDATNAFSNLSDAIKTVQASASVFESAKQELATYGALSIDTLQKIVDKYPALEDAVTQYQAGLITSSNLINQLQGQYNVDANNYRKTIADKLATNDSFYNSSILKNKVFVNSFNELYGVDLTHYKNLAQAKQDVDNQLLKNLIDKWSQFYDAQSGMFTEDMAKLGMSAGLGNKESEAKIKEIEDEVNKYKEAKQKLDDITLKNVSFTTSQALSDTAKNAKSAETAANKAATALKNQYETALKLVETNKDEGKYDKDRMSYYNALLSLQKQYASTALDAESKLELQQKVMGALKDYQTEVVELSEKELQSRIDSGKVDANSVEVMRNYQDILNNLKSGRLNLVDTAEKELEYEQKIYDIKKAILEQEKQQLDDQVDLGKMQKDSAEYLNGLYKIQQDINNSTLNAVDKQKELLDINKEIYASEKAYVQNQLDKESKAIDKKINSYQKQQDAIEKSYQAQIDLDKEQEKALQKQEQALEDFYQPQLDAIEAQTKALQNQEKELDKVYQPQIDALNEIIDEKEAANQATNRAIELEQKQQALLTAQTQKTNRIYREGQGFVYEADKTAISNAQKDLDDLNYQNQIDDLTAQRDKLQKSLDSEKKALEDQINTLNDYKDTLQDNWDAEKKVLDDQIKALDEHSQNLQDAMDKEKAELQKQIDALNEYKDEWDELIDDYNDNSDKFIKTLTNNNTLETGLLVSRLNTYIKHHTDFMQLFDTANDDEDEMLATRQDSYTSEGETESNTYQQRVTDFQNNETVFLSQLASGNTQENNLLNTRLSNLATFRVNYAAELSRIISQNNSIISSNDKVAKSYDDLTDSIKDYLDALQDKASSKLTNSVGYAKVQGAYDNGGVDTKGGINMLHGTPTKPEVIFNATDGKKLYDFVHNTENLTEYYSSKMEKHSAMISNNNNDKSVSIDIGDIILQGVQDEDKMAKAIVDKLPSSIIQKMYKRVG